MPKHTLVSIGWTGCSRVYVDVTAEEATRRYLASEGKDALDGERTEVIEIEDEFSAYEVGLPYAR